MLKKILLFQNNLKTIFYFYFNSAEYQPKTDQWPINRCELKINRFLVVVRSRHSLHHSPYLSHRSLFLTLSHSLFLSLIRSLSIFHKPPVLWIHAYFMRISFNAMQVLNISRFFLKFDTDPI